MVAVVARDNGKTEEIFSERNDCNPGKTDTKTDTQSFRPV